MCSHDVLFYIFPSGRKDEKKKLCDNSRSWARAHETTKNKTTKNAGAKGPPPEITVTVKQEGKPDLALTAPSGANLRDFLTENGINVYQSVTRWTNCKGKQLCG